MTVEIVDRAGWKYARIPQTRGAGRALFKALRTRSLEDARALVKSAKFEEIALASRADALTREVWTRLLAGRNLRVRDCVESYATHRHVIGHATGTIAQDGILIDRFLRHSGLANQPLATLEAAHISAFINQPGPQILATREKWLSILHTWGAWLVEQRWIVKNPALDVVVRLEGLSQEQLISTPHAPFTDAEVQTLLAKVPRTAFWHGAILLGYHYGLRLGAVAALEEGNVVAHRLRLYTKKGRRIVDERLHDDLVAWLEVWRPLRPASELPFLFPAQAAIDASGSRLLSVQFGRLLAKHGITGKSFHGLRKTATARRWSAELDELGDRDKHALMALVAKNGFKKVQEMLAHAPGSSVTETSYMPRA